MNARQRHLAALNHQEVHPVPWSLWFNDGIAARIDLHLGHRRWRERWNPTECGCDPVRLPGFRPVPGDPHRVEDGFGSVWRTDGLARHLERPALAEADLDRLRLPDPTSFRDPARLAACQQQIAAQPDRVWSAGVLGTGLYETTWHIRGFEAALTDAAADEGFYGELIARIAAMVQQILEVVVTVPVDVVCFGDDLGDQNGVTMGPDRWRRVCKPHWARLCSTAHAAGKKVFLHSCGSVVDIIPDLIEVGIDILDPIQPESRGMDPYALKREFGDRLVLCGGLGSQRTIPFGTPASIRAEIARLVHEVGRGGGYILKPAKAVRDETPLENALAVFDAFCDQDSLLSA